MREFLFKSLLSFFGNITSSQWDKAKELVATAAKDLANKPGSERREYVVSELKKLWGNLAPYLINLLVDGAFAFLKAKTK
jgi:hypothetical protein